uniref:Uncharacterized protein n=1 Tax=Arabidopsis thaliana TaxID=3702 RepID=Q0WV29_ARATH|nr:hypothetical protein [Arabidopsis thaliana]
MIVLECSFPKKLSSVANFANAIATSAAKSGSPSSRSFTRGTIICVSADLNVLARFPMDLTQGMSKSDPASAFSTIRNNWSTTALHAGEVRLNADLLRSAFSSATAVISMIAIAVLYLVSSSPLSSKTAKQSKARDSVMTRQIDEFPTASFHNALAAIAFI